MGSSEENSIDNRTDADQENCDITVDDVSDETYQPTREITPVLPRNQPIQNRRPSIRYPAEEYDISCTTIQQDIPEKLHVKVNKGKQNTYFELKLW